MDIIFVLDGSGSITSDNWVNMINFVSNVTTGFGSAISATGTNIGIIQFASSVNVELALSAGTSKTTVLNTISKMQQIKSGTFTSGGVNQGIATMLQQGRKSVSEKLFIHITDGNSNYPCTCYDCNVVYASAPANFGTSGTGTYCKTTRFPGQNCLSCTWDSNSMCNPCADATYRSNDINSWAIGGATNPEIATYGGTGIWNWRQLAVGVGTALTTGFGEMQISRMNYDHVNAIMVNWSNLTNVYQTVIDNSCNVVTDTQTNTNTPLASSGYTIAYLGRNVSTVTGALGNQFIASTFSYKVTVAKTAPGVTVFSLGLAAGYNQDAFYTYSPGFPVIVGYDSTTAITGFNYLSLPSSYTIAPGASGTYSLTITGTVTEGAIPFGIAGGSQYSTGSILGPSSVVGANVTTYPPSSTLLKNHGTEKLFVVLL
jgi:hypothetical protein